MRKKKKSPKWNVNFHATSRLRLMRNFRSNLLQILHLIWLICSAIVRWIYLFYSIRNVVIGSGIYVYLFNTDPLLIMRWFCISLFTLHVHCNILKCIFLPFLFSLRSSTNKVANFYIQSISKSHNYFIYTSTNLTRIEMGRNLSILCFTYSNEIWAAI